jgi:hypothetical protein
MDKLFEILYNMVVAGSDAYLLRTTSQLLDKRQRQKVNVKYLTQNPFVQYVDYTTYRRLKLGM